MRKNVGPRGFTIVFLEFFEDSFFVFLVEKQLWLGIHLEWKNVGFTPKMKNIIENQI